MKQVPSGKSAAIGRVLQASNGAPFQELVRIAGLDPEHDFRNCMLRKVDFSGSDISRFDFTGSQLIECKFSRAKLGSAIFLGAQFRGTDITEAIDWEKRRANSPILLETWDPESYFDRAEARSVAGKVIAIEDDVAIVDIGGGLCRRLHSSLIKPVIEKRRIKLGDSISISEEIADQAPAYYFDASEMPMPLTFEQIEIAFREKATLKGIIQRAIKGGYLINIGGFQAFLPGSQVDRGRWVDASPIIGEPQPFQILELHERFGKKEIVASRRAAIEAAEKALLREMFEELYIGQEFDCRVKNIVDYGAFVETDSFDGLIQASDIAWERITHPSQYLSQGNVVRAAVVAIDPDKGQIALSMKALLPDPWQAAPQSYLPGSLHIGEISNVVDYGIFVMLEPGVEGLAHLSEMPPLATGKTHRRTWFKHEKVQVQVIDVDIKTRRISLRVPAP
ncbi:Polyribonucleotide nucleotidyltransferase (plasmid) [Asticcacaulis sp. MM231]|uniref:S1 RNA-binding domain-containing protein n=1 Tax=Asticcacaulis sp. MM231 TaxID=3157666 RepID=UPI0032D57968